jgi:hypothetical protein
MADSQRLEKEIRDTEGIYTHIEAARRQLSILGDEMRGQTVIIKERINWLLGELDTLKALIKANTTQPLPPPS